jgi:hypothetical protein
MSNPQTPPNGSAPSFEAEKTLLQKLEDIIGRLPKEETIDLGLVFKLLEREGFLLFCIFLTLPFMVPVSIPGVSTVFGLVILLIGLSIVFNITPPLPRKLMTRRFPTAKLRQSIEKGISWIHHIERFSRPRMLALTHGPTLNRFNGGMLVLGAILLMAPFGLIPFSNTLPGLAILFLAVGMLQRDGVYVILGLITNILTIAYFTFLILGGTVLLHKLWDVIRNWLAG